MPDAQPVYGMPPSLKRGEIWMVSLDPIKGSEIGKTRPAIIVSSDAMIGHPVRMIVPLTEWSNRYTAWPWVIQVVNTKMNGLDKVSAADTTLCRSVAASVDRFKERKGIVERDTLELIVAMIATLIEFQ